MVADNVRIVDKLTKVGDLQQVLSGERIITQNAPDSDIYFILAGSFSVEINGNFVTNRSANTHVGEMALIEPAASRSATVTATEDSVVLKVSEDDFTIIANDHPLLWRTIAVELGNRLRQRSDSIRPRNETPILFIGSSAENLHIAREIQNKLEHDQIEVEVWTDGVFRPSSYTLEDLIKQACKADFAVLVCSADDTAIIRDNEYEIARDNVIFELGLFIGTIGRERILLLHEDSDELKLPSDLLGLNPITYKPFDIVKISSSLAPQVNKIRDYCLKHGSR